MGKMYLPEKLLALGLLAMGLFTSSCLKLMGQTKAGRPNILFCIADDASYRHMSTHGTPWVSTPRTVKGRVAVAAKIRVAKEIK